MLIERKVDTPPRDGLNWAALWADLPTTLVSCWDRGREKAREDPLLAEACLRGELPLLPWAGGVERKLKSGRRAGSLQYVAMWQGLRGDVLRVDTDGVTWLVCSRTGVRVSCSADTGQLQGAELDEDDDGRL